MSSCSSLKTTYYCLGTIPVILVLHMLTVSLREAKWFSPNHTIDTDVGFEPQVYVTSKSIIID